MRTKIIKTVVACTTYVLTNDECKKMIFGSYSDGSPRCLVDAVSGEFISSRDRENVIKSSNNK